MTEKIKKANNLYKRGVELYTRMFCDKHEMNFDDVYRIGGAVGEVCDYDGDIIDFRDIKADIDLNAPEEKWWEYQSYYDFCIDIMDDEKQELSICNYENFVKGCPLLFTKEEMDNYNALSMTAAEHQRKVIAERLRLMKKAREMQK